MLKQQFIDLLRCPETGKLLSAADAALLARVNQTIAQGTLQNRAGHAVAQPLDAALVREDQNVLYPIQNDIPLLLIDEGILLNQLAVDGKAS
ncbi:MAG TPA: hypothetical protein VFE24_16875 [Pirellulales bacterium]|jgi:uncharacterized protein YbaR (Trm112 family)|nr:hypothetical protein [Pirellulales bacterium]